MNLLSRSIFFPQRMSSVKRTRQFRTYAEIFCAIRTASVPTCRQRRRYETHHRLLPDSIGTLVSVIPTFLRNCSFRFFVKYIFDLSVNSQELGEVIADLLVLSFYPRFYSPHVRFVQRLRFSCQLSTVCVPSWRRAIYFSILNLCWWTTFGSWARDSIGETPMMTK